MTAHRIQKLTGGQAFGGGLTNVFVLAEDGVGTMASSGQVVVRNTAMRSRGGVTSRLIAIMGTIVPPGSLFNKNKTKSFRLMGIELPLIDGVIHQAW